MSSIVPTPRGWQAMTFADVVVHGEDAIVGGPFGSSLTTADYVDAGVPVIRGSNLAGEECRFVDDGFVYVSAEKAKSLARNTARPGDMIFTQRGTLGQVAVIPRDARFTNYIVSQSQMRVRVREDRFLPRFLYWYYRSPVAIRYLESRTLATGVPHINLGILKEFPVMAPDLAEQRHIAAILDEADALRRKRREALALLDDLLRATFLDMFGDPVTNPKRWPVVTVGQVVSAIESGWSPTCEARPAEQGEWGVLKLGAVTTGRFIESHKALPDGVAAPEELEVCAGDVLFTRKNTYELVGAAAYVHRVRPKLLLPDLVFRLRLSTARIAPAYLATCLMIPGKRDEVQSLAAGSSGSMPGISKAKLATFAVPLPPVEGQRRFHAWVDRHERYRESVIAAAAITESLLTSLLSNAFSEGI